MVRLPRVTFLLIMMFIGCGQDAERNQLIEKEPLDAAPRIRIVAQEMEFLPISFRVREGDEVLIEFKNDGRILHDWNMRIPGGQADQSSIMGNATKAHTQNSDAHHPDHNHPVSADQLHLMAGPGQNARLKFRAIRSGTYEYYCSIPGHREAGMVGLMYVE